MLLPDHSRRCTLGAVRHGRQRRWQEYRKGVPTDRYSGSNQCLIISLRSEISGPQPENKADTACAGGGQNGGAWVDARQIAQSQNIPRSTPSHRALFFDVVILHLQPPGQARSTARRWGHWVPPSFSNGVTTFWLPDVAARQVALCFAIIEAQVVGVQVE